MVAMGVGECMVSALIRRNGLVWVQPYRVRFPIRKELDYLGALISAKHVLVIGYRLRLVLKARLPLAPSRANQHIARAHLERFVDALQKL